jgi:hypothetical protein
MSDNLRLAITRRDRAMLQAVFQGLDLPRIAAMRAETPEDIRVDLQRVLAVLLSRRQPLEQDAAR